MIEQGRITQLIESKPEERRLFIEEVAGILKYKLKRKEAESKIKLTRENLDRVEDIILEVRKNLNSLRQQAARAKQFKKLQEELRSIEEKLIGHRIFLIEKDLQKVNHEIELLEDEITGLLTEISDLSSKMELKKSEMLERENDISLLNKDYFEKKLKSERYESEIRNRKETIETLEERIEESKKEIESLETQLLEIKEKRRKEEESLEIAKEDLVHLEEDLEEILERLRIQKNIVSEKEEGFKETDIKLKQLEQKSYVISSDRNYAKKEMDSLSREVEEKNSALKQLGEEISKLKDDIEKLRDNSLKLEQMLSNNYEIKEEHLSRREELEENINKKEAELNDLTIEMKTLENRFKQIKEFLENREGFSENVKKVIKEKAELIKGVIGDFIDVKDKSGNFFDNFISNFYQVIVPKDTESFFKLITYCRENELKGIGILFPDDNVDITQGGEKPIYNFLSITDRLPKSFKFYLEKISIENSFKSPDQTSVFFNGDYFSGDTGIYYAGSGSESGFLFLKSQLKEIRIKMDRIKGERERLIKELETLKQAKEEMDSLIFSLETDIDNLSEKLGTIKSEMERKMNILEIRENEKNKLETQLKENIEKKSLLDLKIRELSQVLDEINGEIEKLLQKREGDVVELSHSRETLEELQDRYNELAIMLEKRRSTVKSIEKEIDFLEQKGKETLFRIEKIKGEVVNGKNEIEKLRIELSDLKVKADSMVDSYRKLSVVLNEKKELLESIKREVLSLEKSIFEKKRIVDGISSKKQEIEIKKAELQVKFDDLKDYQISRFGKFKSEEIDDYQELQIQFEKLSSRIENFGAINLLAIEECATQEERYNFLMEQKKDLERSIKNLTGDIKEIDRTTVTLFSNAFEFINRKFDEIFKELFGGGKAYLKLSDEENLLESGVEIYAKVPGETIKRISLLSGGEKAKTALALVFALFEYRVSPLCVLDEVDAPLDEANVLRFGKFLKKYKNRVQFLIITHNKTTMELSDYIYGITMEEPGCSKVFSVKLEDFVR